MPGGELRVPVLALMVHERWFEDRDTKTTDVSDDDLNTAIIRSIVFSPEERLSIDDHLQEMRRRTQLPYEAAIKVSPREFPIPNVAIVCMLKNGQLDILRREQPGPVPFYNPIDATNPEIMNSISSVCQKALGKRG